MYLNIVQARYDWTTRNNRQIFIKWYFNFGIYNLHLGNDPTVKSFSDFSETENI